ncbi:Nucleoporin nup85 [Balamuthia mandrillaris]
MFASFGGFNTSTSGGTGGGVFGGVAPSHGVQRPVRRGFTWGATPDQLLLWATAPPTKTATSIDGEDDETVSSSSSSSSFDTSLRTRRWNTYLPETRKLLCESHQVFLALQEAASTNSSSSGGLHPDLMRSDLAATTTTTTTPSTTAITLRAKAEALRRSSKHYRALLHAQVAELQQRQQQLQQEMMTTTTTAKLIEEYRAQTKLFRICELIWHLCEILFLASAPGTVVTAQLVDWLQTQTHYSVLDEAKTQGNSLEQTITAITSRSRPEDHPLYWELITKLLLRGQVQEVRQLLACHSQSAKGRKAALRAGKLGKKPHDSANSLFYVIDVLLKSMPRLYPGDSVSDFFPNWKRWQEDCSNLLERRADIQSDPHFTTLFNILSGNHDVLVAHSDNWLELLVAELLYCDPTVKNIDLRYVTERCVKHFSQSQPIDEILLHIVNSEIYKAITTCSKILGSWWFVAHLTDILSHAGQIESLPLSIGTDLREHFLLEYSQELLSHSDTLWRITLDYLSFCPTLGRQHMEQLLERQQPTSDRKVWKLLSVCSQYHLYEQARTIQIAMGLKKYREGQYGACVQWLLRAKASVLLAQVANKLVEDYYHGKIATVEDMNYILDNAGVTGGPSSAAFSDKLAFLNKYRELDACWKNNDFGSAVRLTLELLTTETAPRRFWMSLLRDIIPLLECSRLPTATTGGEDEGSATATTLFSIEETHQLMRCLEEINLSHKRQEYVGNVSEMEIQQMRLALARNLARAFVIG